MFLMNLFLKLDVTKARILQQQQQQQQQQQVY